MEFLGEQPNEHRILSALRQLPKDWGGTYKVCISRIAAQSDPEQVKLAMKALRWLTFVKGNLSGAALLHALAIQDDSTDIEESDLQNIEKVISLSVGLVVLNHENGEIRLVHETTQEYVQEYFCDVRNEDGNAEIAIGCLRYFSFAAFLHSLFRISGRYTTT